MRVTCASATLPVAVPLLPNAAAVTRAGSQSSGNLYSGNSIKTAHATLRSSVDWLPSSRNPATDTDREGAGGDPAGNWPAGTAPIRFADIIRQVLAPEVPRQAAAGISQRGTLAQFQSQQFQISTWTSTSISMKPGLSADGQLTMPAIPTVSALSDWQGDAKEYAKEHANEHAMEHAKEKGFVPLRASTSDSSANIARLSVRNRAATVLRGVIATPPPPPPVPTIPEGSTKTPGTSVADDAGRQRTPEYSTTRSNVAPPRAAGPGEARTLPLAVAGLIQRFLSPEVPWAATVAIPGEGTSPRFEWTKPFSLSDAHSVVPANQSAAPANKDASPTAGKEAGKEPTSLVPSFSPAPDSGFEGALVVRGGVSDDTATVQAHPLHSFQPVPLPSGSSPETPGTTVAGAARQRTSENSTTDEATSAAAGRPTATGGSRALPVSQAGIIQPVPFTEAPSRNVAPVSEAGTFPRIPRTQSDPPAESQPRVPANSMANVPARRPEAAKEPAGPGLSFSGISGSAFGALAPSDSDREQDVPMTPASALSVDAIAPLAPLKPEVSDKVRSAAPQGMQFRAQPAPATTFQSEAALTIVIRTGDLPPAPAEIGLVQRSGATQAKIEGSGNAETFVAMRPADASSFSAQKTPGQPQAGEPATVFPVQNRTERSGQATATAEANRVEPLPGETEVAIAVQITPEPDAAGFPLPMPANTPSSTSGAERGKPATGPFAASSVAVAAPDSAPQTAFQDLPLKADPVRTDDDIPARDHELRPPAAPPEPSAAERNGTQPLRSVTFEFAPDGTRDVRVRLSERAGEVHVSVHSADPSIAKNLRDGVTDLASVLAHAGYDAKTWTHGRQQREHPQPRDEQAPRRRSTGSSGPAENFDGVLRHGVLQTGRETS